MPRCEVRAHSPPVLDSAPSPVHEPRNRRGARFRNVFVRVILPIHRSLYRVSKQSLLPMRDRKYLSVPRIFRPVSRPDNIVTCGGNFRFCTTPYARIQKHFHADFPIMNGSTRSCPTTFCAYFKQASMSARSIQGYPYEDGFEIISRGQHAEHVFHRQTFSANIRLSAEDIGIDLDAVNELRFHRCLFRHGLLQLANVKQHIVPGRFEKQETYICTWAFICTQPPKQRGLTGVSAAYCGAHDLSTRRNYSLISRATARTRVLVLGTLAIVHPQSRDYCIFCAMSS